MRAILYEYDALARVEKLTSYATTTGGTIRNQIQYEYDQSLAASKSYQSHEGAVSVPSTPAATIERDFSADGSDVFDDAMRVSRIGYPAGKSVYPQYGTSGSTDDLLSRTYQLQGNFTGTTVTLSQYKYNGPSRLVETYYNPNAVVSRLDVADGDGTRVPRSRISNDHGSWRTQKMVGSELSETLKSTDSRRHLRALLGKPT